MQLAPMKALTGRLPLVFCAALLFIWSLPGTIALRHLLLAGAIALLVVSIDGRALKAKRHLLANLRAPGLILLILSLWFLIQAIFVSDAPRWAVGELKGQWLTALLAGLAGLMLGLLPTVGKDKARGKISSRGIVTTFVIVLLVQTTIAAGQSVWHLLFHGELLRQVVPLTGGKLEMSFVLNLMLAVLAVDILLRVTRVQPILVMPAWLVCTGIALGLLVDYLAGARNGVLGAMFLSVSVIVLVVFHKRNEIGGRRTATLVGLTLLAVGIFAVASYKADARWQDFAETAAIAWKVDEHKAWLDSESYAYPKLADGTMVDPSAYLRISWLRIGGRLIVEHPAGVGYGRNAFAHALRKTDAPRLGHAHSGFIDLGVGTGIPGIVLWLALMVTLMAQGLVRYFNEQNPYGLALFLVVSGFTGRMIVDSVNRDHMLQMFFFLAACFLAMSIAWLHPASTASGQEQQ